MQIFAGQIYWRDKAECSRRIMQIYAGQIYWRDKANLNVGEV